MSSENQFSPNRPELTGDIDNEASRPEERIETLDEYSGNFGPRQPDDPPGISNIWRRHWKNPDTGRQEVHWMDNRYGWQLSEHSGATYTLTGVLLQESDRDHFLVLPTQERIMEAEHLYKLIDDSVDRVAAGELCFGIFQTDFDDGDIMSAKLRIINDTENSVYFVARSDWPLLTKQPKKTIRQRCFFKVIAEQENHRGVTFKVCRIVGVPPVEMPKFFRRTYIPEQLRDTKGIEPVQNRLNSELLINPDHDPTAPIAFSGIVTTENNPRSGHRQFVIDTRDPDTGRSMKIILANGNESCAGKTVQATARKLFYPKSEFDVALGEIIEKPPNLKRD